MKKTTHLSGQTLIEVLTSLSILSLVFVMGMMLFQRIIGIHAPNEQQQTRMMISSWMNEPFDPLDLETERDIRGRLLRKQIRLIDKRRQVYEVRIEAYWGKQRLDKQYKVFKLVSESG
ncbi:MAG: hypothetical protein AAF587_31760 [Bacteroidota bacterium]